MAMLASSMATTARRVVTIRAARSLQQGRHIIPFQQQRATLCRSFVKRTQFAVYAAEAAPGQSEEGTQKAEEEIPDVSKLDIRVGTILSAEDHPEADSLYVESIDLGEEEGPRTIVSGLKKYVSLEDLTARKVLVLANLKARNMRGIKSHGMLLCASNSDHTEVEPLSAPADVPNGERVFFGDDQEQGEPALPNQLQKKKFWEKCQPLLKTDATGIATFENESNPMMTTAGPVKAARLFNATIS